MTMVPVSTRGTQKPACGASTKCLSLTRQGRCSSSAPYVWSVGFKVEMQHHPHLFIPVPKAASLESDDGGLCETLTAFYKKNHPRTPEVIAGRIHFSM